MFAPSVQASGYFVNSDLTPTMAEIETTLHQQPEARTRQALPQIAHFPVLTDGNEGHGDQGALHMQAAAAAAAEAEDPWQGSDPWSDQTLPQAEGPAWNAWLPSPTSLWSRWSPIMRTRPPQTTTAAASWITRPGPDQGTVQPRRRTTGEAEAEPEDQEISEFRRTMSCRDRIRPLQGRHRAKAVEANDLPSLSQIFKGRWANLLRAHNDPHQDS